MINNQYISVEAQGAGNTVKVALQFAEYYGEVVGIASPVDSNDKFSIMERNDAAHFFRDGEVFGTNILKEFDMFRFSCNKANPEDLKLFNECDILEDPEWLLP